MRALKGILGVVAVVALAIAIFGIAQGKNEYQEQPEPTAAQVQQSRASIAANSDATAGRAVFTEEGCNRCHTLAAIGADGKLGPRLDGVPDEAEENAQYIASSKRDSDNIMPRDYGSELSQTELKQLGELIHAAYIKRGGGEQGGGDGDSDGDGG